MLSGKRTCQVGGEKQERGKHRHHYRQTLSLTPGMLLLDSLEHFSQICVPLLS